MSLDKMSDVKAGQFEQAVQRHANGIAGVEDSLKANPMPPELLEALQTGVGDPNKQHGR